MFGCAGFGVCRFGGRAGRGPLACPGATCEDDKPAEPVTVERIGAALAAWGCDDSSKTASEHAAQAARLGGARRQRVGNEIR